jgi:hypothetical protein
MKEILIKTGKIINNLVFFTAFGIAIYSLFTDFSLPSNTLTILVCIAIMGASVARDHIDESTGEGKQA